MTSVNRDFKNYYLSHLHIYHQLLPASKYDLFIDLQDYLSETEEEILFNPEVIGEIIDYLQQTFRGIDYLGALLKISHTRSAQVRKMVQNEIFTTIEENRQFLKNYTSHILFIETFHFLRTYLLDQKLDGRYYFNLLYPGRGTKRKGEEMESTCPRINVH